MFSPDVVSLNLELKGIDKVRSPYNNIADKDGSLSPHSALNQDLSLS